LIFPLKSQAKARGAFIFLRFSSSKRPVLGHIRFCSFFSLFRYPFGVHGNYRLGKPPFPPLRNPFHSLFRVHFPPTPLSCQRQYEVPYYLDTCSYRATVLTSFLDYVPYFLPSFSYNPMGAIYGLMFSLYSFPLLNVLFVPLFFSDPRFRLSHFLLLPTLSSSVLPLPAITSSIVSPLSNRQLLKTALPPNLAYTVSSYFSLPLFSSIFLLC